MSDASLANFYALALGFAIAGLLASAYQAFAAKPLSFRLLEGRTTAALAAVPLLTFGAPFIIMRNTIRGRRIEKRRFEYAMAATIIACFWSLMSGTVAVELLSIASR
ncbi:MAG: DUF6949 family protein [Labrys sp. (in: a-proteobacteria)]